MAKSATIYTNDPKNPKIEVTLTGDVIEAAAIEPKAVRLIGRAGEKISAEVKITPPSINRFDITDVKAEDGTRIGYKLGKKMDSNGSFFILHVDNAKHEAGRYFDRITLKTTSAISPELHIRVFGIIRDAAGGGPASMQ